MTRARTDERTGQLTNETPAERATGAPHGPTETGDQPGTASAQALGLAVLIVVAEYLARRFLASALPSIGAPPITSADLPIGAPVVNDMLATALIYTMLVALVVPRTSEPSVALAGAARGIAAQARRWLPWVGGLLFLAAVIAVMPLDTALWGGVRLPSFVVPPSTTVLFASAAVPLAVASLLLVNGVVIPLAEERLLRGMIQPRLRVAWGVIPALLVTATLFSLKHAIVDASLGRLLALTAGGLVLGLVAHRASGADGDRTGWKAAAISHMVGNIIATSLALASGAI